MPSENKPFKNEKLGMKILIVTTISLIAVSSFGFVIGIYYFGILGIFNLLDGDFTANRKKAGFRSRNKRRNSSYPPYIRQNPMILDQITEKTPLIFQEMWIFPIINGIFPLIFQTQRNQHSVINSQIQITLSDNLIY